MKTCQGIAAIHTAQQIGEPNFRGNSPKQEYERIRRPRRASISQSKRYLIACAHLLFVRRDPRDTDTRGNLLPSDSSKKSQRVSLDLEYKEMATLYFDNINKTIISQSKKRPHLFASPDWSLMESYLFPWIQIITSDSPVSLTRMHIKHIAFRILECLVSQDRVVVKHKMCPPDFINVPLGEMRGWWLHTDGDMPPTYDRWCASQTEQHVPGMSATGSLLIVHS